MPLARPFSVGQAFPLAAAGRNACPTRRRPSSMPEPGQSGGEAFATGAMRDRIRVGNFKTALLQVVTEIED